MPARDSAQESCLPDATHLGLARLRRDHPAFDGEFAYELVGKTAVRLNWTALDARLELVPLRARGTGCGVTDEGAVVVRANREPAKLGAL